VAVLPAAAFYSTDFSEFLLPYEAVRTAEEPEADLTAFLSTTYTAAADLAGIVLNSNESGFEIGDREQFHIARQYPFTGR
jgi:hypothetical protein